MSEKLSFEEIVNLCDLDTLQKITTIDVDENGMISPDSQRQELAKIARLISRGHPGYKTWDRATTEKFEKKIEDLYNSISEPKKLKTKEETNEEKQGFYNRLDTALQLLPDEHLKVSPGQGNLIPRDPNVVSVGENS